MTGDIFDWDGVTDIWQVEARDAAKHSTVSKAAPHGEDYEDARSPVCSRCWG